MSNSNLQKTLQNADRLASHTALKVYREIPTREGAWQRCGQWIRLKLVDLEPALPPGLSLSELGHFRLARFDGSAWQELPVHLDYSDSWGRWTDSRIPARDMLLCFRAPLPGIRTDQRWPDADADDIAIPLMLWDSWHQARCEGLYLFVGKEKRQSYAPGDVLSFLQDDAGLWVVQGQERLICFDPKRGYQLSYASVPGRPVNLIEPGRTWRWMLTEDTAEMVNHGGDRVSFELVVAKGAMLVARLSGESCAGRMQATLRIFEQSGALILEFSDYRSVRNRPELPAQQHPHYYAGQMASPYPGVHYAAFMVDAGSQAQTFDHFYKYGPRTLTAGLEPVFEGRPIRQGYNWMALQMAGGTVGITAHNRSHEPDHSWKAGLVDGRAVLALEPFGSIVENHYHACDRYMLMLAPEVADVPRLFEALDIYPILMRVPLRRSVPVLDVYERFCRWINLNLDYLMKGSSFRNALLTNGQFKNDTPTCMAPIGELIRLYEKTGWDRFRDEAVRAADVVAAWIKAGRFHTRGEGLDPNGGGIYQNEQIYLLLSMARVARLTGSLRLRQAITKALTWLYEQRGGLNTWGWKDYPWHAGGFYADGKPLYFWPVNTNQWATLNFRLYQLLGDTTCYERAMQVLADYLQHTPQDVEEIVRGGGISDTTRGVHFFTEAMEIAGADPRMDVPMWRRRLAETLERFWIRGWVKVRNSIYMEAMRPGRDAPEPFSEGFKHSHNVGSFLDILPRIQIAAEAGISEYLTRWAMRDLALDFDLRYGMEEHTYFTRFGIRDTDIEPACWLDPEMLSTMWAVRRRGWIDDQDYALLRYKVYQMMLETFIPLDETHGGWAAAYDVSDGQPIRVLNMECIHRHPHERFRAGEPKEMWGIATREAYHDHSTHYWSALEQFVDALGKVEEIHLRGDVLHARWNSDGLAVGVEEETPILVPMLPGAKRLILEGPSAAIWHLVEQRAVQLGGQTFWLALCRKESQARE